MENYYVDSFATKTGCDLNSAYMILETNNWDLTISLNNWYKSPQNRKHVEKQLGKKLARGISRASDNENLITKARDAIAKDFENKRLSKISSFYIPTMNCTFMLPDLTVHRDEFRHYLENDLTTRQVMDCLEDDGKLNWWCEEFGHNNRLWALSTAGDGNCLLHAASLATFGFHDRMLTLRMALHHYIVNSPAMVAIKRRWRWQQTKRNIQNQVSYSEKDWEKDWDMIVNASSAEKRKSNQHGAYESLEEFHIFVLAHVLQRVIIVIAETFIKDNSNQPLSPVHFAGVYCPLECDQTKCLKNPILIAFDKSHFSALVFMEKNNDSNQSVFYVPLTDKNGDLLPLQFSIDPGPDYNWEEGSSVEEPQDTDQLNILKSYLNVVDFYRCIVSPDNESEDEIERQHFIEYDTPEGDANTIFGNRMKAAKQLQVFGKQMENLGKSVSKKLKKNFGSLTKLALKQPKRKEQCKAKLSCAEIRIHRHAYQNEMIDNYLRYATENFLVNVILKKFPHVTENEVEQVLEEGLSGCINTYCESYSTYLTSYMCYECHKAQEQAELLKLNNLYRGVGKSKFYGDTDTDTTNSLLKSALKNSHTLHLSNSTFYNGSDIPNQSNTNDGNNNNEHINTNVTGLNDKTSFCPNTRSVDQLKSELDFEQINCPVKTTNTFIKPNETSQNQLETKSEFNFGQVKCPIETTNTFMKPNETSSQNQLETKSELNFGHVKCPIETTNTFMKPNETSSQNQLETKSELDFGHVKCPIETTNTFLKPNKIFSRNRLETESKSESGFGQVNYPVETGVTFVKSDETFPNQLKTEPVEKLDDDLDINSILNAVGLQDLIKNTCSNSSSNGSTLPLNDALNDQNVEKKQFRK